MLKRGYKIVRYADDFIVFASSRHECEEIDQYARCLLARIDLTLPELGEFTKTEIAAPGEAIDFLGLSLNKTEKGNYGLFLTHEHLGKISRKLGEHKDIEKLLKDRINFIRLGSKLDSSLGGYRAAYACADNAEDLDKLLIDLRVKILRSVLVATFGEESVGKISKKSKIFMGLEASEM